jgi:hypothetical protein
MIDKITENDIKSGSPDDKWYQDNVLSEEQLNLLIKNKFERYKTYQNNNELLV